MADLHILPGPEDAAHASAEFVAALSETQTRVQGRFTIALSGGSTPRRLYRILASTPYAEGVAWDRWRVFWGDERCVPPDHRDSNYRMAREALLDHVPVPAGQVHRIRGEASPQVAAEEYEKALLDVFGDSRPAFDLILLGIGEDGHTASLFPGSDALEEEQRLVVANWASHLQAHRITFTLSLINAAATVAFLVTEESKARVLKEVLEPTPGGPVRPAALVRPTSGVLHWFLTPAAASQLQEARA
ncbi:MAG: 6-phosphogluconolactonase [Dehalococcoidia bacterium]